MAFFYYPIPNDPFYSDPSYSVQSTSGPLIVGSGLSITSDGTLVSSSTAGGTVTSITAGVGLSGGTINVAGTINLLPATMSSLGGIKVGANLAITPDGTLNAMPPGTGTISSITVGAGLQGGGVGPAVTLALVQASTTELGAVVIGDGLEVSSGVASLGNATTTQIGGVLLATHTDVNAGVDDSKAVTPAGLAAKVASTTRRGIVQLSDSLDAPNSNVAATQTAAFNANATAIAAQTTANAALSRAGGTMTGVITFAPGQAFPGVAFPPATTNSLGAVSVGPGLSVNGSGVLSTVNNGTVTAVTAGPGLGAPASGNTISESGTLRLLPPTTDGQELGGVKAGENISIAFDGTISVPGTNFISTNNPYAYNGYMWPVAKTAPALPFPGVNGQVLTVVDSLTGEIGWTSTGTLQSVVAGPGITVTSTPTTATVSLSEVPSIAAGDYGGQALIPTLSVNSHGQIVSVGQANPFSSFQTATVTAPPNLVLNFAYNNLMWDWVLQGNVVIQNPQNAHSGQTGFLRISQNPLEPFQVVWGSAWKFENSSPYEANQTLAAVDLIEFVVVSPNYIVVTKVVRNIG